MDKQETQVTWSSKLSTEETLKMGLAKLLAFADKVGLEFHVDREGGESYLRTQVGKRFATSPKSFFQDAHAYLRVNLPGAADEAFVGAVDLVGLGNSQQPSTSSEG